jgi:serine/threonine protein kinase
MTPERWQRIDEWVAAALELGASQREAFLTRVCAGDNDLRREVESLIAANVKAEAKDFLGAAALANCGELFIFEQPTTKAMFDNPTTLNERYLIERELGHGGIGVVYLARDQKLHSKYVVIKVLQEGNGRNDFWKQRFFREIEALARFENPHIVSIFDTGELPDGSPFFVMEYLEGSNLRSVMRRESLGLGRVARLMRQISHAIGYAHERAVFHRDLKPENIMVTGNDDFVIVIDFGIATVKELRPATRDVTTVVSGTPPYMAPEQLMGEPSAASDIWALGVLAYEMLTGRVPFVLPKGDRWLTQLYKMQQAGVKVKPK